MLLAVVCTTLWSTAFPVLIQSNSKQSVSIRLLHLTKHKITPPLHKLQSSEKLCMFFWVFPRRQIVVGRRFGTLYQFHLQRLGVQCEV